MAARTVVATGRISSDSEHKLPERGRVRSVGVKASVLAEPPPPPPATQPELCAGGGAEWRSDWSETTTMRAEAEHLDT